MPMPRRLLSALMLLASLLLAGTAQAALIGRTITLDGSFADWNGTGGTYTPPGNILTNSGQSSTDCASGTSCERDGTLGSTGRDLKGFAFTWDNTNLYFYLERWDNSSNVTDWWFYMDINGDQKMNTGEKVLHVKWSGSNRSTTVGIVNYFAATTGGDIMQGATGFADGYRMPGSISAETALYSGSFGGTSGLQMEARVAWSSLGLSGPSNMGFHMSSSNGSNLPGSIIDNMDGPSGNQLFPGDLQVNQTVSPNPVMAGATFTYTITVTNLGYNAASNLVINDVLPTSPLYLSHVAASGTFADTNANGIPDRWTIPSLAGQASTTLTVNMRAPTVTANTTASNTATLQSWTGINQTTSNDSASTTLTILPTPQLTTTKTTTLALPRASPGDTIRYRVNVSNAGFGTAQSIYAVDALSPFTALRLDTFGAGQPVRFTPGTVAPGVTLGTVEYSSNGGSTWTYPPVSGGGGAPAGFDANVTHLRVNLNGIMNGNGASFLLEYDVIVR